MRWSAIQDSCFVDPEDGWTKMWSESHVSEGASQLAPLAFFATMPALTAF